MSRISGLSYSTVAFGSQQQPTLSRTRRALRALFPPNPTDNMKRGMAGAAIAATTHYMGQTIDNPELISTGVVLAAWAKTDVALGLFRSVIQHLLPR